jgi:hypothetical protein
MMKKCLIISLATSKLSNPLKIKFMESFHDFSISKFLAATDNWGKAIERGGFKLVLPFVRLCLPESDALS